MLGAALEKPSDHRVPCGIHAEMDVVMRLSR